MHPDADIHLCLDASGHLVFCTTTNSEACNAHTCTCTYTSVDTQRWTQMYADVRNACIKAHTNYECKCTQM